MLKASFLLIAQFLVLSHGNAQLNGKYEQYYNDTLMSFNNITLNFKDSAFQYKETHCLGEDYGSGTYKIRSDTLILHFGSIDSMLITDYFKQGAFKERLYEIQLVDQLTRKLLPIDSLLILDKENHLIEKHYSIKDQVISIPQNGFKATLFSKKMSYIIHFKPDRNSYILLIELPYFHTYGNRDIKKFIIRNQTKESLELGNVENYHLHLKHNIFIKLFRSGSN